MIPVVNNISHNNSLKLDSHLLLKRCPHCSIDSPNLVGQPGLITRADDGSNGRHWRTYICKRCGGVVTAFSMEGHNYVIKTFPSAESVDDILPFKVKAYLQQAIDSTFAPAGSVMLSASSVDAMLKEKGYVEGSLYKRIEAATTAGLLTAEMGTWAHQVRLDANDQRHADENAGMPTVEDAKQAIEFAKTLAEFLFVLPAKVTRGLASSGGTTPTPVSPSSLSGNVVEVVNTNR